VAVRILLWHGYLLTGSGSNVYSANVAESWRAAGHDVLILCQEPRASEMRFVDATGRFESDNRSFELLPTGRSSAVGSCSVLQPDIDGLLPVFVYDDYEGFSVKLFVDLTDEELQRYTELNTIALRTAIEKWEPDAIIAGHEVMGPYIAEEACASRSRSYVAKLHGSGLEYAVKLQDRYQRYASLGLNGAAAVVGGSRYMVREASTFVSGWEDKAVVVNPGCDVRMFAPAERPPGPATIGYVGKLIASKGVHDLIAALGLLGGPDLRAVIVGYGGFEASLRGLAAALSAGDLARAREIAARGDGRPLHALETFLEDPPANFCAGPGRVPVTFTGRLEHGPLSKVLPAMNVLVVPSVLPEAFGMVAAEAAACGVLPVVPDHSGIGEAGKAIEEAIGAPGLLTYDAADPIHGIAEAIGRVLGLPAQERARMEKAAANLARARWSWEHVARELAAVATAV
jgi:glycosyltransferase involved in cell wall biosynthesis